MSIPVSIDPMGTLGDGLPFVQPNMTSYTDWSNTTGDGAASCGFVLAEENLLATRLMWHAFSDVNSYWSQRTLDIGEYYSGTLRLTRGRLKLSRVKISVTGVSYPPLKVDFLDNAGNLLFSIDTYDVDVAVNGVISTENVEIRAYTTYKGGEFGKYAQIKLIEFKGFYKP